MKIGALIHIFNARMREARKQRGLSQSELAKMIGVSIPCVQFVETLRQPEFSLDRAKDILTKISVALDVPFDELFPDDYLEAMRGKFLPKKRDTLFERDVRLELLPVNYSALALPAPDELVEGEIIDAQIKSELAYGLDGLTTLEREVIEMRFGLKDGQGHTLEEVGQHFRVTRQRIRQIEANALSKLRHYKRSRPLRDLLRIA